MVEAAAWGEAGPLEALVAAVAAALSRDERIRARLEGASAACVAFTSDAEVRRLNAAYRGIDKPTNVLSFPSPGDPGAGHPADASLPLGDVVLADATVAAEAAELGIPLAHHIQHLVTHGALHLLGFDHETDADADVMEGLERELLAGLGIPDPYRSAD